MRIPEGFVQSQPGVLVRRGYETEVEAWLESAGTCAGECGAGARDAADVDAQGGDAGGAGGRERGAVGAEARAHGAPGRDAGRSDVDGAPGRASRNDVDGGDVGGRGGIVSARLRDGARAYVRRYRHGGLLGDLLGEAYFDRPPRPWRELAATEAARRSGVEVPEVLAAAVQPIGPAWLGVPYRGLLVTRAIEGRRSLAAALRAAVSTAQREAWVTSAARAVRRLHAAGIHHPDLNVTNFLVGDDPAGPVAVIDFDRAAARARPVGALGRRLAARRLARSIGKLALPGLDRAACRALLRELLAPDEAAP